MRASARALSVLGTAVVAGALFVAVAAPLAPEATPPAPPGPPPNTSPASPSVVPGTPPPARPPGGRDAFGVRKLLPDLPGGTTWTADWSVPRRFNGQDPLDAWFNADHGRGSYVAAGGELRVSGKYPRMHVRDPQKQRQWRDVEITAYFKRVDDAAVPYAGMVAVARTNHGDTGDETRDLCDTRGYGGRLRYDGTVDLEKETRHPLNIATSARRLWPELPRSRWLGHKFVVRDLPRGHVQLEVWLDETEGRGGGAWRRVHEFVDRGARG